MNIIQSQPRPGPWIMAVSYVLLLPMLFYAAGGEFSFESKLAKTQSGSYQDGVTAMQSADAPLERGTEIVVVFSVLVCSLANSFRRVLSVFKELPSLLLMILWAMASTVWSHDPMSSARNSVYLFLNTAFGIYLSKRYPPHELLSFMTFVGTAFLVANYGVCLLFPRYGTAPTVTGMTWQGICPHKNVCAYMTVFFMSGAMCQKSGAFVGRMLKSAYVLASLLLILLTQSRTGWIMAAFLILFIPILRLVRRMARRDSAAVALASAGPLGIGLWAAWNYLPLFFSSIGKDASMSGRLPIWTAVTASILKHPFIGYGYRAFWHNGVSDENASIVTAVGWNPRFAHNGLLEIGLELGSVGMVLAVLAMIQALRNAKRGFRSESAAPVEWYICIVFLTLIVNIDEATLLESVHLGWTFFVIACAGLSVSARKISEPCISPSESHGQAEKLAA